MSDPDPLRRPTALLRAAGHARAVAREDGDRWSKAQAQWAAQLALRCARRGLLVVPGYDPDDTGDALHLAQRMLDRIRTEVIE